MARKRAYKTISIDTTVLTVLTECASTLTPRVTASSLGTHAIREYLIAHGYKKQLDEQQVKSLQIAKTGKHS